MNRVSPELDKLMWTLAEQNNPRAFDEFESRHPELVAELGRRIAMLRSLKGERDSMSAHPPAPRFRPVDSRRSSGRGPLVIGGMFALAGLALGSFYATRALWPESRQAFTPPPAPVVEVSPPAPKNADPVYSNELPKPSNEAPPPKQPEPPAEETPAYLRPRSVKLEKTSLSSAIQLIAGSGGLQVEIAPGMPNPDVKLSYQNVSAVDMLNDLARQYAFTVMDEGGGKVLIVPVRDDDAPDAGGIEPKARRADSKHPDPASQPKDGSPR